MGVPFTPAPPPAITRVLATFDRDQLAGFIAVAIDLLDLADGDPDLEDDDPAGCDAKEDIGTDHAATAKMGWDISFDDIDKEEDDHPGDPYTEDSFDLRADCGSGPGCPISDPGGTSGLDC